MRKAFVLFIIILFFTPVFAEDEYNFSQKDIDKFLSFADAYIKEAKKYVKNSSDLSIEELYYNESEDLMDVTENFLKKYGWDYLKLNDFLYVIRITLDYIGLLDSYGDVLGEELDSLGEDISKDMLNLVRKNKEALGKYFAITDYSDIDDTGDYEDYESSDNEDYQMPDFDEEAGADISGIWYLSSDKSYIWNFSKNGTLTIGQITPVAAEVVSWEGTYTVSNNQVTIELDKPHPFPDIFTLKGDKLTAPDDSLVRNK